MNIRNTKELGGALRARRKQLKVTQKELAMTCGTGLRFIVDLEKGKSTCHIEKILQVVQALGFTVQLDLPGAERNESEKL